MSKVKIYKVGDGYAHKKIQIILDKKKFRIRLTCGFQPIFKEHKVIGQQPCVYIRDVQFKTKAYGFKNKVKLMVSECLK